MTNLGNFLFVFTPTIAYVAGCHFSTINADAWRSKLTDHFLEIYPAVPSSRLESNLRVIENEDGSTSSRSVNIGFDLTPSFLTADESSMLLNEVRSWTKVFGSKLNSKQYEYIQPFLERQSTRPSSESLTTSPSSTETLNTSFLKENILITDHAEGCEAANAPWGSGDRLKEYMMPSALRHLVRKIEGQSSVNFGRLRHVRIEYSASSTWLKFPSPIPNYDGYEYYILPLRANGKDTVVTFSPIERSRSSGLSDFLWKSFTTKDIDALLPSGGLLRVAGTARFKWSWCMRPIQWWSSPRNVIRNDDVSPTQSDGALLLLSFEAPYSSTKTRLRFFHEESAFFGDEPTTSSFNPWMDNVEQFDRIARHELVNFIQDKMEIFWPRRKAEAPK